MVCGVFSADTTVGAAVAEAGLITDSRVAVDADFSMGINRPIASLFRVAASFCRVESLDRLLAMLLLWDHGEVVTVAFDC